jgi:hypothetical protein
MNPDFDYTKNTWGEAYPYPKERLDPKSKAATDCRPRPTLNGTLLINPAGTIWIVIDGVARGYSSPAIFDQVHFRWYVDLPGPTFRPVRMTHIETIAFIPVGTNWHNDLKLVRNSRGTVALFDAQILYGIPSPAVMNYYQYEWGKVQQIPDEEFGAYPMPLILNLPPK